MNKIQKLGRSLKCSVDVYKRQIQNYENAYWAGVMSKLEQILKDEGYDATIVG